MSETRRGLITTPADIQPDSQELRKFCRARYKMFYLKADIAISDEVLITLREKREKEIESAIPEILGVCKKVFGRETASVLPMRGAGTFHWLYEVRLSEDQRYIFRVSTAALPYREFHFLIDRWVMAMLKEHGLPYLEIVAADLSRRLCPFDYEIMPKATGRPLGSFDDQDRLYKSLTYNLGQVVARLHSLPCSGFGALDIEHLLKHGEATGIFDSWREYLFLNLGKHIKACVDIGAISDAEAARIEAVFDTMSPLLGQVTPSLLHSDLGAPNIFSDGHAITALLDWEDCLVGDAVFDIAFWGTFYINDAEDRLNAFTDGYRAIRPLPADFELRYWLYYLRAALAKTVHRYRFRYPDPVGGPPAWHRIQKGLLNLEKIL